MIPLIEKITTETELTLEALGGVTAYMGPPIIDTSNVSRRLLVDAFQRLPSIGPHKLRDTKCLPTPPQAL